MIIVFTAFIYLFVTIITIESYQFPSSNIELRGERKFLDLGKLTTLEVQEYVASRQVSPIVITVGATEQHGPTGLIGTDYMTAAAVAKEICDLENVILGPQLQVGMSIHHTEFPGTVSLMPSTFVQMICDIVWSLHHSSKFTHFFFINGHGGNVLPLKLAMSILRAQPVPSWVRAETSEVNLTLTDSSVFKLDLVSWYANSDSQQLARSYYGDELGQHATPDEVSPANIVGVLLVVMVDMSLA